MSLVIEAHGLSKAYRRVRAVTDLTFTVGGGTIFALLGPNGSGKTTTIKLLLNLHPPSSGRASVLGTPVERLGVPELRQIGYVSRIKRRRSG